MDNETEARKLLVNFDVLCERDTEEEEDEDKYRARSNVMTMAGLLWLMDRERNYRIEDYLDKRIDEGGDHLKIAIMQAKLILDIFDRWGAALRIFLREQEGYFEDA